MVSFRFKPLNGIKVTIQRVMLNSSQSYNAGGLVIMLLFVLAFWNIFYLYVDSNPYLI